MTRGDNGQEMKWGAFSYSNSPNVGDEIQTLAALQFVPKLDFFLDRDHLQELSEAERTCCFFNGWFKHGKGNWPPPSFVMPLFVSFHVEPRSKHLISPELKSYYKQYEPIGCRSLYTVGLFNEIGVEAYFSGCVTLTLSRPAVARTDHVVLVDIPAEVEERLIPPAIRETALSLTQLVRPRKANPEQKISRAQQNILKLTAARERLMAFATARLVITSRLHVALPCLAMGTPVIVVFDRWETDPRFSGLHPLLRCFTSGTEELPVQWNNPEANSNDYTEIRSKLEMDCLSRVEQVAGKPVRKQNWWETDLSGSMIPYARPEPAL